MTIRALLATTAALVVGITLAGCSDDVTPGSTTAGGLRIPEDTSNPPPSAPIEAPGSKLGGPEEKGGGAAPPPRPRGGGSGS